MSRPAMAWARAGMLGRNIIAAPMHVIAVKRPIKVIALLLIRESLR
jgi:hypothetical protein